MKRLLLLTAACLSFMACDELDTLNDLFEQPDVVAGLKEALTVGTDTATAGLGAVNGYLNDQAVKILLPDEMQSQINQFKALNIDVFGVGNVTGESLYNSGLNIPGLVSIPALSNLEDDLITGVNRAAESAATEAGPIFVGAITSMSFSDANEILFGADNAATQFFIDNTYDQLFSLYEPKLDEAISSVQVGGTSVESLYSSYVNTYNDILGTSIPTGILSSTSLAELAGLELLENPDLSEFATGKGLDGLFLKVEEEEKAIRTDPLARVTKLLEDVFSLQD